MTFVWNSSADVLRSAEVTPCFFTPCCVIVARPVCNRTVRQRGRGVSGIVWDGRGCVTLSWNGSERSGATSCFCFNTFQSKHKLLTESAELVAMETKWHAWHTHRRVGPVTCSAGHNRTFYSRLDEFQLFFSPRFKSEVDRFRPDLKFIHKNLE